MKTLSSLEPNRQATILALALGLFCLVIYTLTLHASVPGGDSGELITVAYRLGIAHPPGYPLFTVLAHLFTYLPFGTPAWQVNLFSAVCNSVAVAYLLLAVYRWTRNPWAGFLAAGLFAFSPLIWRYSVTAEVFALNNLFACLLFYFATRFKESPELRWIFGGALTFGLGMSNHHTLLFFAFPIFIWACFHSPSVVFRVRPIAISIFLFALGLIPYLYFLVAPSDHPLDRWGDPTTWSGFIKHLFRQEYGTLQLGDAGGDENIFEALGIYGLYTLKETLYIGLPFALWSAHVGIRSESLGSIAKLTAAAVGSYLVIFHTLANMPLDIPIYLDIQSRFWQMPNVFIFSWIGLGFAYLIERFSIPLMRTIVIAATLVVAQLGIHYSASDQSNNRIFESFGYRILNYVDEDAIVLSKGDVMVNSMRYLKRCENVRPDVDLIDREMLKVSWIADMNEKHYFDIEWPGDYFNENKGMVIGRTGNGYNLKQFIQANISDRPIYAAILEENKDDMSWADEYQLRLHGFIYQLLPKSEPFEIQEFTRFHEDFYSKIDVQSYSGYPEDSWEYVIGSSYFLSNTKRAGFTLDYALKNKDKAYIRKARKIFEHIYQYNPEPRPELLKDLGVTYYVDKGEDPSFAKKMVLVWREFLQTDPDMSDPEVAKIQDLVAKYKGQFQEQ